MLENTVADAPSGLDPAEESDRAVRLLAEGEAEIASRPLVRILLVDEEPLLESLGLAAP